MKKKLSMLFLLVITLFLASCAGSTSREKNIIDGYNVEPAITLELAEKYNLGFAKLDSLDTTALAIGNNKASSESDYYTVYMSKNVETTLLRYRYKADEELRKHIFDGNRNKNKAFIANTVYFTIMLDEAEKIAKNEVKDENNQPKEIAYYKQSMLDIFVNDKVNKVINGSDSAFYSMEKFEGYNFTIDKTASFSKAFTSYYAADALIDGKKDIYFEVVYLPLFVVRRNANTQASVILYPVYETFTVEGLEISSENNKYKLVESKISTIPAKEFVFDEETGSIFA